MLFLEDRRLMATFTVTNTSGSASVSGSLPAAIAAADAVTQPDQPSTIDFEPSVFSGGQTISLGGTLDLTDTTDPITITGPAAGVTIAGDGDGSVFTLSAGVTATLSGLTITGGSAQYGGGLENHGTITLDDCTIVGNSAEYGGGLENLFGGRATLDGCTIGGNSANVSGGGLENLYGGTATLDGCTIGGNSAASGGGLYNEATARIDGCTISGNSARSGGGLYNTISGGLAGLTDTIVAGNIAATDGDIGGNGAGSVSGGYNLIGTGGSGGLTAADHNLLDISNPDLAPLGDYGGPTPTMPLLPGSLAFGAGVAIAGFTTDQRGFSREGPVDIGAFQAQPSYALVVSVTGDAGAPPAEFDLRGAVDLAEILGAPESITFDPSAFATPQTIALIRGQLEISDDLTIAGPSAGVTISGGGRGRVFQVDSGATARLSGLTITGGLAYQGGGLLNDGTATLVDVTVSGNSAEFGGGLFSEGQATLDRVTVSGNSARYGGGLLTHGTATLDDVTVSGNSASYFGGGLRNYGTATLDDVTVSGNSAWESGGLLNQGTMTLNDVTVSGNIALYGGGLYNIGTATLIGTIVAAQLGGGDITNDGDLWGVHDLIGDGDGQTALVAGAGGNLVGTAASPIDPLLAPLGDYGGPTPTMPLLPGSPAIGAGVAVTGITTDQRGLPLDSPAPDIGAFQLGQGLVVNATVDGSLSPSGDLDLRQALTLAELQGGAETITFDPTAFATSRTIALTAGTLALSSPWARITVAGPAAGVTIAGDGHGSVFTVSAGVTATLSCLTITGGSARYGGGLENIGMVTLVDVTVSGNSATFGGGVANYGTATLDDVTVSGNSAGFGGGLLNQDQATLDLDDDTVSGNSAEYLGGGLLNHGTATLIGTIVAAQLGGGDIMNDGDLSGDRDLIGDGAGQSALVAGAGGDLVGTAADPIDPLLAPLGDYGGPTPTMALLPGSPAIGAGVAVAGLTTDQRGLPLDSPDPDIGAFQSQGFLLTIVSGGTPQSADVDTAFADPLAVTVTARNAVEPVAGGVITFTAPSSGASAVLSSTTATIGSNGQASVTATADGAPGNYTVTASATGVATPADFSLTNLVPTVTAVSSTTAAGTYGAGSVIVITIAWSEAVVVTGTPTLALNSGGTALYTGGSGTKTLTFSYTVAAGQDADPLDEASAAALTDAGGTIAGGDANLTLPAPGTTGSLGADANIVISTAAVTGFSVSWGASGTAALVLPSAPGGALLPAGRKNDLPWLGIDQFTLTLSSPAPLAAGDVTVTGVIGVNYGPVTVTAGPASTYTITLAAPIDKADRLTIDIGNAAVAPFSGVLDVLPGDVGDYGVVNATDMLLEEDMWLGAITATIFGDTTGDVAPGSKPTQQDFVQVRALIGTTLPPSGA